MDDETYLYILSKSGKIIFTPAPFSEDNELLVAHLYTNETAALEKIDFILEHAIEDGDDAETIAEIDLLEITLEEALVDYLVEVLEQVEVAYVVLDDEEIYPFTQEGFDVLKDVLEGKNFSFVDLEDSIHTLYYRLCELSDKNEEEIESILEDVSVQDAMRKLNSFSPTGNALVPVTPREYQLKLTRNSLGYSACNEDYTYTISLHEEGQVQQISKLLGGKPIGYVKATRGVEGKMELQLDELLTGLEW